MKILAPITRFRYSIIALAFIFICSLSLKAQHFEVGIGAGISNYGGDLTPDNFGGFMQGTNPSGGAFVRYNAIDYLTVRLGFNYARITGNDRLSSASNRRERNLSFHSNLYEFGLIAEGNVLGFQPYNLDRPFSPYIFVGIVMTKFNPKTKFGGVSVPLQPLGTEGQGLPGYESRYKLLEWGIPLGVGVKYALSDKWNIGAEIGARRMFTDYLDDVHGNYVAYDELFAGAGELAAALGNRTGEFLGTNPVQVPTGTPRGENGTTDWYFIFQLTVSYNFIDNGLIGSRKRSRRGNGCKTY